MKKTYQPVVKEVCNEIIFYLENEDFFIENEVSDVNVAIEIISDALTNKFIEGKLEDEDIFNEHEWKLIENNILLTDALRSLEKKGFLISIDDDDDHYLLTDLGKKIGGKL